MKLQEQLEPKTKKGDTIEYVLTPPAAIDIVAAEETFNGPWEMFIGETDMNMTTGV